MNLIGQKVIHKIYKSGTIKEVIGNTIRVKFDNSDKEMKFLYPECFKSHLILENSEAIEKVKVDSAEKVKQDKIKKENEKIKRENDRIISEMSRSSSRIKTKDTPIIRFKTADEYFDHYMKAVSAEIFFLKKSGGKHITVYDGRFIERQGLKFIYEFDTDSELNYPDNTEITLYVAVKSDSVQGNAEIKGTLENCSEFTVLISTEADLGHSDDTEISSLEFSVEGWRLLSTMKS